MVPANDADLPQPRLPDGSPDPQFQTTKAKRYLGKHLLHDPARATRIIPEFGGIPAHSGSASCGTCHLGEAASKSGTLLNFATDADGNFIARRLPLADLPILRQTPLFPGDALVDELPTLTDIYLRTLTLRQLRDAKFFFRSGLCTSVKDVVRYCNTGVPQNAQAVATSAFTSRFSHPRGPGSPRGLGLSNDEMDDLTDFIENGLYDPAFLHFAPNPRRKRSSSTSAT